AGIVVIGAATFAIATRDSGPDNIRIGGSTPTTAAPHAGRDSLQFREVLTTTPYPTGTNPGTQNACEPGGHVPPASTATEPAQIALPDRKRTACYVLGKVLLTGHDIVTAQAVVNPTTAAWEVNLHFANDNFVTKVAAPYEGRQIAIVVDGVVESAPTINPGITGQDVTISGSFDEATARAIARRLS
ncbi:MAG TPA: hypothetical protein VGP92_17355, partial [Acidimicrobiia bacterium]|nr:hypothetical protein [Acidimicrobiia bacterium]